MSNKQVHFRCSFNLKKQLNDNSNNLWTDTLKLIRNWVSEKIDEFGGNKDYFFDAWYFNGGYWNSNNVKNLKIETVIIFNDEIKNNKFWSLRFEHMDKMFQQRNWVIDFVIEYINDDLLNFSLTTSHFIRHDYIGKEPELPTPTAPKIVNSLLQKYDCYAGNVKLSKFP
ncbi:MAG TPA: hypothetical protein VGE24_10525, partial [Emticicia sp.]